MQILLSFTVSIEIVIPSVMSSIIMILFSSALFHLTSKLRKNSVKVFWSYLAQKISIKFNDMKLLLGQHRLKQRDNSDTGNSLGII